jgi:hypothetical protein
MNPVDRQRLLVGLALLAMALFVATGYPPAQRWRPQLKIASIIVFCVAVAAALVEIALWWATRAR